MKHNIVLIGFMGVGKGNLSRALVKEVDMMAIDTDDLIESMENRFVKKIFKHEGEPYFRALENKVCEWIAANVDNTIISTGGGFPIHVENPKAMGKIFYLKNSFDGILHRIHTSDNPKKKIRKRPLFADPKKAKVLFDSREARYAEVADVIIDVEGKKIGQIVDEVLKNR